MKYTKHWLFGLVWLAVLPSASYAQTPPSIVPIAPAPHTSTPAIVPTTPGIVPTTPGTVTTAPGVISTTPGPVTTAPIYTPAAPIYTPLTPTPVYSAPSYVATPAATPAAEAPKADEGPWRIMPEDIGGFKITGWIYGTGNYNATNTVGRYNGPMTTNDQEGAYLNQLWINIKRDLGTELGWGANLDIFYGNDYLSSQSRGWENAPERGWLPRWNSNQDYGFSIPQAYVEFGTKDYNVKVGHFYTPHGYMVVQAPSNFFNTMPWDFMMSNPFSHWGVMGTANVSENLQLTFGLVNGWDALDRPVDALAYMGGMKVTFPEKKGYWSINVITGLEPENRGTGYANRTLITSILDYNLTDNIEFVLESNYGWQGNHGIGTDEVFNLTPYLFFKINESLKAGLRYEYFYDPYGFAAGERVGNPNNGPIPANVQAGPYRGSFQTIAAGLNWAPGGSKNFMLRPELRYDWFNGSGVGGDPFSNGKKDHQIMMVLGAILQF